MTEKDLRVLLISPLPPPAGGIATWTEQYIQWTKNRKINIDIVNSAVIGRRAQKINSNTNFLEEIERTKSIVKELRTKIDKFKPQIIHLNTPCGKFGIVRDFICAQIAIKNSVKLIVHYRCNIEDQVHKSFVSRFFLKRLSNIADLNLVLNSSSSQYLMQGNQRNSILIANFINESFALDRSKSITTDIKIISFVGHVQRAKGILEIIHAAKELPEITFKIAGPISGEISKIEKPKNMVFLGVLSKQEVKILLQESDLFLFPTYTEGFANALLEAMAVGLPIITTPVGANVDMLESMGGVIVEVGNSKDIVDAIYSIKSPVDRTRMSEWNLNKVKNEYTIDKVMEKLMLIYLNELSK